MKKYFLFLLLFPFVFSCTPSKELIYLQGDSLQKKEVKRLNDIPYKLQVNDLLLIGITSNDQKLVEIFNMKASENNNFLEYSIDDFGNIRIPTVGSINVLGHTIREVRKKIEHELEKFIKKEADIFVSVKLSGIKYTIIGEISNPGVQVVSQNKLSIIDAIANSGDITITGNRKNVEVIRNSISGTEKFLIDLTDMNAFNSDVFYIKPNDIIYVSPLKQNFWSNGMKTLQSISTVISLFISVFLLVKNT